MSEAQASAAHAIEAPARLFIDTEFTSLSDPRLISIAAVSDDHRHFYGVVTDYPHSACTSFVTQHVLPLLDLHPATAKGPYDSVARAFRDWIEPYLVRRCEIIADDECDIELARQLLAAARISPVCPTLSFSIQSIGGIEAAERELRRFFELDPLRRRHNALDDARAYCAAIQVIKSSYALR